MHLQRLDMFKKGKTLCHLLAKVGAGSLFLFGYIIDGGKQISHATEFVLLDEKECMSPSLRKVF